MGINSERIAITRSWWSSGQLQVTRRDNRNYALTCSSVYHLSQKKRELTYSKETLEKALWMRAEGIPLELVAKLTGIPKSTLSDKERGIHSQPRGRPQLETSKIFWSLCSIGVEKVLSYEELAGSPLRATWWLRREIPNWISDIIFKGVSPKINWVDPELVTAKSARKWRLVCHPKALNQARTSLTFFNFSSVSSWLLLVMRYPRCYITTDTSWTLGFGLALRK